MYQLLIVDDEPFIADGLTCYFESLEPNRFEITTAYSAEEALSLIAKTRVDIVISDIRMKGMDGLTMLRRIKSQWPTARVILLSGYSDFDYIHTAMEEGADTYILKSQGDDAVLDAVNKSIEALESASALIEWKQNTEESLRKARPLLQQEYLMNLLEGDSSANLDIPNAFMRLKIPLDPYRDVLFIGARLDHKTGMKTGANFSSEMLTSVDSVLNGYVEPKALSAHAMWNKRYIVWMLQPKKGKSESTENFKVFIEGMLDKVQQHCSNVLNVSVSFVSEDAMTSWQNSPDIYDKIRRLLVYRLNAYDEMVIGNVAYFKDIGKDIHDKIENDATKAYHNMEIALEYGQKKSFITALEYIISQLKHCVQPCLRFSLYHKLCNVILSYVSDSGRTPDFIAEFSDASFLYLPENRWDPLLFEALYRVTDWLFCKNDSVQNERSDTLIFSLHQYIHSHLNADLSLFALGEKVYLSPVYLSRVYKQKTGQNLSRYVLCCRIEKAKDLLLRPELKVSEIAYKVGFESAAHFSRVFRKEVEQSPNEYRLIAVSTNY